MAKKHEGNHLGNFFGIIAAAGRAETMRQLMQDYREDNILAGSPIEHVLGKLLGANASWVFMFNQVYTGELHGHMLIGAEDEPAVQLAQAMMMHKHGFIQHPLMNSPAPIHPKAKEKIDNFIRSGR